MNIDKNSRPLILDGGFGSTLEGLNINVNDSDMWSFDAVLDSPKTVFAVHQKFIEAGAQVILSNTYHAAVELVMKSRKMKEGDAVAAIWGAVDIAKNVARQYHKIQVVGSMGPYAIVFRDGSEYSGHYINTMCHKTISSYYKKQMDIMLATGLEWFALETVPTLKEAKIALDVWKSLPASRNKKIWISFNCKDFQYTCGGDLFADCVKQFSTENCLSAIGINCTAPDDILPLVTSGFPYAKGKPFVVYPNHGEKYNVETQEFELGGPDLYPQYLKDLPSLLRMNVKLFGGCCRVGPEHIVELKSKLAKAITAEQQ